jgi:hypothetical protein
MKLIKEWRRAWRFLSVQTAAIAVILGSLPVETQAAVMGIFGVGPERMPAALGIVLIVARLIDQAKARGDA